VTAPAQSAVRARVDNDAFNVWLGPWDRPDEEYSNGVRLSVDWAGPAFWWKRFDHDALGCATGRDRCVSHTLMLGQDIYTAARQIGEPLSPVCSRPDAGLLWLQESERVARDDRLDEFSITIASLASRRSLWAFSASCTVTRPAGSGQSTGASSSRSNPSSASRTISGAAWRWAHSSYSRTRGRQSAI
jgi:hypothetical protein